MPGLHENPSLSLTPSTAERAASGITFAALDLSTSSQTPALFEVLLNPLALALVTKSRCPGA